MLYALDFIALSRVCLNRLYESFRKNFLPERRKLKGFNNIDIDNNTRQQKTLSEINSKRFNINNICKKLKGKGKL